MSTVAAQPSIATNHEGTNQFRQVGGGNSQFFDGDKNVLAQGEHGEASITGDDNFVKQDGSSHRVKIGTRAWYNDTEADKNRVSQSGEGHEASITDGDESVITQEGTRNKAEVNGNRTTVEQRGDRNHTKVGGDDNRVVVSGSNNDVEFDTAGRMKNFERLVLDVEIYGDDMQVRLGPNGEPAATRDGKPVNVTRQEDGKFVVGDKPADEQGKTEAAGAGKSQASNGSGDAPLASSYGDKFAGQSYVKDGSDPQLLSMLQKAVDTIPELKDSPIAQHVQAGKTGPEDVKLLQEFLQSRGFSLGKGGADGKYGPFTHGALEGFLNGKGPTPRANAAADRPGSIRDRDDHSHEAHDDHSHEAHDDHPHEAHDDDHRAYADYRHRQLHDYLDWLREGDDAYHALEEKA